MKKRHEHGLNNQQTDSSKQDIGSGFKRKVLQWLFVCASVLVFALFLVTWLFHFSEAWRRAIQTLTPLLVIFGLLLIYSNKSRNAKAIRQKLGKLEGEIKRTRDN